MPHGKLRFASGGIILLLVPALVLALVVVGLLAFVIVLSLSKMDDGIIAGFAGITNFLELLSDPSAVKTAANTAIFAAITVAVSFAFGVPLAWLAERTALPARAAIWTVMLSTLIVPGFLTGMGWLFLAHPRIGVLNTALMAWFHLGAPPFVVNTIYGMGIVQGIGLASLTFVLVAPSLRAMDPSLEEAARMSGASAWFLLREVTLPLIRPALLASAMYVTIVAIGAFDIPAVIGLSARVYTFSTYMYSLAYPTNGFPDYGVIAAGGTIMIVLALVMTAVYARVLHQARRYQVIGGKGYRPRLTVLGGWNVAAWSFVGLYILLALVAPFTITLLNALLPYTLPLSSDTLSRLSLVNFQHIPWEMLARGALHSLEIVAIVPVAVVIFSVLISWIVLRTKLPGRFLLDSVAFLPHAVPGVLFGIGASLLALFVLQKFIPIYGTIALVMVVYTIGWLSFGTRMINASLIQISSELVEAGQMAGGTALAIMREIVAPLLRSAFSGLWIYVALLCLRELTLAAFVTTPKNLTLPMVAWFLWNDGSLNQGAAVAVLVVLAVLPFLFLYVRFGRGVEEVARST
jgi:iron(III) transport system permease protein